MTNKEKFKALVSKKDNSVLKDIENRMKNREWLRYSRAIALKVLMRLDELNSTQKKLADEMGVSAQLVNKWLKGKENLTLETIARLEKHLGISLIEVERNITEVSYDNEQPENILLEDVHSETKVISINGYFPYEGDEYNNAV